MKDLSQYEESDFFSDDLKLSRQERKRISRQDRSKYKKTDQEKHKKAHIAPESCKEGLVISIHSQEVIVKVADTEVTSTLRGTLKQEKQLYKNLLVVGDKVLLDEEGAIIQVLERKTVLSRADHLSQQKEHLICANVDQVLITVSVVDPALRTHIIDRYLIAAKMGDLLPIIICNKIDLLDDPHYPEKERTAQKSILDECCKIYAQIGIRMLEVSSKTGQGMQELETLMKDRISVFSGQSGTGKSSLINIVSGLNLKVGKTVQSSKKGAHTTSHASLIPLSFGGFVVDTPGIKSFGVWNVSREDVKYSFSEIEEAAAHCKFQDCFHQGEQGCAIPEALEKGLISPLRFESYLNLLASTDQEHLRR